MLSATVHKVLNICIYINDMRKLSEVSVSEVTQNTAVFLSRIARNFGVSPQREQMLCFVLETLLEKWILQSEGLIISYCNYDFNDLEEIPPAVVNVCLRLTANMVALAQARKDTPVIQVKEWNVQTVSSNIFSNDLKRDLTPFVHERKSYKGDEIDFFVITGDDDSW